MLRILKLALAIAGAAAAVTPAAAQMFLNPPDFKPGPIEPSDPLVGLPLPGATPAEYRSAMLWNLRAGLNVAALQCQFSPFLRTVGNYNGFLAQHSEELADAYKILNGYFARLNGAAPGQKKFDDYTTITYNGFSTFQAQYGFCQVAADIAKEALLQPKGTLYELAQRRMRELRNSLTPATETISGYNPYAIPMPAMPILDENCYDKKDQLKPKCAAGVAAR